LAKIVLEGPQPFDLEAMNNPTSTASRGIVAVTLPVYDPRSPSNVVQIRLLMTPEEAEYMSRQLGPVVTTARMQLRNSKLSAVMKVSHKKPKLTDTERHARFLDVAKKVEASEKPEDFDLAFEKVVKPKTGAKPDSETRIRSKD